MFYPVESLRRGGRFYLCWVADSWPLRFATITQRQLRSQDVRILCDDLMEVMNRESGYASTRFSLRLSSQLMRGLVRLYQRKVVVFLGDLCMLNATVIKHTNKKWGGPQESVPRPKTPRRTVVVEEVPEVEERIEERIQKSGNIVANIEEITLKEAAIPEIQVPADGFGEENPEQALQLLNDRTLEQMLGEGDRSAVHHSGLDLPMLDSTEKSHDKSRLYVHDAKQMERISELDMTMFGKSTTGDDPNMQMDLEKDTPQIPEIPIPDLSVPLPDKQLVASPIPLYFYQLLATKQYCELLTVTTEEQNQRQCQYQKRLTPKTANEKTPDPQEAEVVHIEKEKEKEPPVEFELEELEKESAEPKRKRPRRLIVDKKIKTTGNAFRQRLDVVNVELRCEDGSEDIADALSVPAEHYFRRPSCVGWRVHARLGTTLTAMFLRNLGVVAPQTNDEEMEQMLGMRPKKTRRATHDKTIDEDASKTPPVPAMSAQQMSAIAGDTLANVTAPLEPLDIADMPTQLLLMSQEPQKRRYDVADLEDNVPAKKPCRSGYVSFRESQRLAEQLEEDQQQLTEKEKDISITVTPKRPRNARQERKSKENQEISRNTRSKDKPELPPKHVEEETIPFIVEPETELRESQMNEQDREKHVSQLLEAAGLADAVNVPTADSVPKGSQNRTQSKVADESSETPLGSLDRTRVEVDESVKTTDTQRFLRTEWGTQGTMLKVVKELHRGRHPLTVKVLVDCGPVPQRGLEKFIAARCFTSLLKLKQHGFIKLEKDAISLEVTDILCGSKIKM